MNRITIFTPAYNRAHTLQRLYDSIKKQTYPDFEWIIVDDGSKDETKKIVESFILENKIDIKYFYQENSGKHIAINKGVEEASGNLFFMVDSDDFISEDALNVIDKWEKTLENGKYIGVAGLRSFTNGNINGTTFKNDVGYLDCTSLERPENGITGDKAEVVYTDIFKNYKFPKFEGENFLCEGYVWNKISRDGYDFRWINETLVIGEYLEDGLTKNISSVTVKCPKGFLLYMKDCIKYEENLLKKIAHSSTYIGIGETVYSKEQIKKDLEIGKIRYGIYKTIYKLRYGLKENKEKK